MRIGIKKISTVSSDSIYVCNPEEFHKLTTGLRQLKLQPQERIYIEPPTGEIFERLSIILYDKEGEIDHFFYAEDDNTGRPIGNIAIGVDRLKKEIQKLSPSFCNFFKGIFDGEKVKQSSWGEVIFIVILVSIASCILAFPTYIFVKPTDDLFIWLWIAIGITELFLGILSNIGDGFKCTSNIIDNFETVCFIIGILALIAYIVLWIFQMFFWWA